MFIVLNVFLNLTQKVEAMLKTYYNRFNILFCSVEKIITTRMKNYNVIPQNKKAKSISTRHPLTRMKY